MDQKKIDYRKIVPLITVLLLFNLMIFTVCKGQNVRKIDIPNLIVEAENFISNSGNILQVEKIKKGGGIRTNNDEAWLSYKLNIPVTGRYNIRIYASNTNEKEARCWIEDYIDNKDGRTYNISGDMVVKGNHPSKNNFTQKDAAPLAAGIHYIKLHIEKGAVTVDHLTFTMMKENMASPVVFKQNTSGKEWQLEWSDEFDGAGLPDSSKWTFDIGNWGWGNNELQYYTNKRVQNARQENGNLIIEARKNDNGFPWSSARLTTRGKESFLYGRIEFRARVPLGRGTWSAGWLLGDEYTDEFSWPYCGEIDVLESVGFELDGLNGNGKTHASVHCGTYYFKLGNQKTAITDVENMSSDFHTYTLDWFPDSMLISVDGEKYFNYHDTSDKSSWPFNKPQNLILNLAIGGGWGGAKGVDSTLTSQKLIIDYVRVYSRK